MNYYELQIETAGPGVELVENELTELGITQFAVDDPNLDIQMMDEAWGTEYVDREEILARKDRSATVTVYTETLEEAEAIRRKLQDWMPAVRNRLASGVYGENLNADSLGSGKIRLTLREMRNGRTSGRPTSSPQRLRNTSWSARAGRNTNRHRTRKW